MIKNRIKVLEQKHYELEKEIEHLNATGNFTDDHMRELKKKKLSIKDELSQLRRREYEDQQYVEFDDDR